MATCSSYVPYLFPTKEKPLIIAGKLGPEPEILINMYKQLIESETPIKIILKPNFGNTNFLYEALKAGDIDIYPEFTGTITSNLLKEKPAVSTDSDTVYQQARAGILKQDHLVLLKPMAYQNTYALAIPSTLATQKKLVNITDLIPIERTLKAGFTLEFNDRDDGNKGLKSVYGLHLNTVTMEPAIRYKAIQTGKVQVIDAYSTDPEITQYHLTILKDNKHLFPPYQGAPLMSQNLLKKHPELEKILNKLSGKITEEEMSTMNYEVAVKGLPARQVARNYLYKQGLIKK